MRHKYPTVFDRIEPFYYKQAPRTGRPPSLTLTLYTNIARSRYGKHVLGSGVPIPKQFSDLTLPQCQKLWKDYQISHAIASGAEGFKLDEDDVDVSVGFNDSTVFPSGMLGYQFHNRTPYCCLCIAWPTQLLLLHPFCEQTRPVPHSRPSWLASAQLRDTSGNVCFTRCLSRLGSARGCNPVVVSIQYSRGLMSPGFCSLRWLWYCGRLRWESGLSYQLIQRWVHVHNLCTRRRQQRL